MPKCSNCVKNGMSDIAEGHNKRNKNCPSNFEEQGRQVSLNLYFNTTKY